MSFSVHRSRLVSSGVFGVDDAASAALAIVSGCVDTARWYPRFERRTPAQLGASYADIPVQLLGVPTKPAVASAP